MNKKVLQEFLKDPLVREAYKTDGIEEVARMAAMIGNLEKNQDLREFAERLFSRYLPK